MKIVTTQLTKEEILGIQKEFGNYVKITADIEARIMVIGIALHADAESILLEKGGYLDNLWGGGVNFLTKQIDATAVYNIRPRLGNNNLEILDPEVRKKFIDFTKYIFANLYE